MANETLILMGTAASIGFLHTLFGPDHYLPFIAMSKARRWGKHKTLVVTFLCGIGHVASSIILGFIGIALGIAVFKLESIEAARGDLAAWLLIIFGFTYFVWGMHKALRGRAHTHAHIHPPGLRHSHTHLHASEHSHVHGEKKASITPWILFTIFVFGPCEPLIPILMYPAASGNIMSVIAVTLVFGLTTIGTMLAIVLVFSHSISKVPLGSLGRYSHALAGFTILLCGGAIKFLGL